MIFKEEEGNRTLVTPDMEAPALVNAMPPFAVDLEVLGKVCEAKTCPLRAVRWPEEETLLHGLGEASGLAFGAAVCYWLTTQSISMGSELPA